MNRPIELSRRSVIKSAIGAASLLGAGSLGVGSALARQPVEAAAAPRRRSIRLAHLTDLHIQPERHAVEGVAACLRHMQSQTDKPELVLTGGDHVMDAFEQKIDRATLVWGLLTRSFKDENAIPMRHCLGNHDIWGWDKAKSATSGAEKGWGKAMAVEQLQMPGRYYSFDQAGWHFVVLDSIQTDSDDPAGYVGGLDDEQFAWFKKDLAAHKASPTLILTHIPILTVTVLDTKPEKGGDLKVSGGLIFTDLARVKGALQANPQVKAVISGHMHRLDRVEFQGVTHYCNGAVCGSWWKGANHETREGYTLVDLYDDGSVERQYVTYGWKADTK